MNKDIFNSRGFTIMEMLAVIAIIVLMTTLMLANYHQNRSETVLEVAANTFAQDLRRVQEMALSAVEINSQSQPGYGIYIDPGQTAYYKIFADANKSGQFDAGDLSTPFPLGPISLAAGIYIKSVESQGVANGPMSIIYMPPEPSAKIMGSLGEVTGDETVILALTADSSKTRAIHFNKAGLIYVQ